MSETVVAEIRLAWWLPLYVEALCFFASLVGSEPDEEKLARVVESAIRVVPVR